MARACLLVVLWSAAAAAQDVVPPRLLADAPAPYPVGAEGRADVELELTVDAEGDVVEASVVELPERSRGPSPSRRRGPSTSLGELSAFERAALHAAPRLKFAPATVGGAPRAVRLRFTYVFVPPEGPRALLEGVVRSRGSRAPVPYATLTSGDRSATTDDEGRFALALAPGAHAVKVEAAGFQPQVFAESLAANERVTVAYTLLPSQLNPYQTVVRAERAELARVELRDAEIRDVPGTYGDPFRVVMLLPGVAAIASGVSYPVVRGSSPAATGYFLDGIRVPQLFHVFLGPAIVHPDFIDSIDFYAGGAPVRYGRLLGGSIEGQLTKPRTEGFRITAGVDLMNVSALIEVPIARTDTQLAVGGRISFTELIIQAGTGLVAPPATPKLRADFWDYQARVDQGLLGGKLRVFAFGSSDVFGTIASPLDPQQDTNLQTLQFHRLDVRYRHALGPGEAEAAFTVGQDLIGLSAITTFFANDIDVALGPQVLGVKEVSSHIDQRMLAGRLGWSLPVVDGLGVNLGFAVEDVTANFQQSTRLTLNANPDDPYAFEQKDPPARATLASGFVELPWEPRPSLRIVPGVRFDHWHLRPEFTLTSVDPRVAAFWHPLETLELHASVGSYHQAPTFLINLPVVDVASTRLGLQDAVQMSVGAKWKFWRDVELSVDTYLNVLRRSVEVGVFDDEIVDPSAIDPNQPPRVSGEARRGRAYGVEGMIRWPQRGRFFGWVTASLSHSERHTTFQRLNARGQRIGNEVAWLPYAFDQTFVANLVTSYRFDNGFSVGSTLHFNTGRPETGELTSRTSILFTDRRGTRWVRVSRDQADRLPSYFRLDLRVSKTWLTDKLQIETYLDVLNVLAQPEVLGYRYLTTTNGIPIKFATAVPVIIPNLGVKVRY